MLKEYESNVNKWLEAMGWKETPFTLKILPSLFVGYKEQLKNLIQHIREGHKFALILGATGSGKTTLMKLLKNDAGSNYHVLYFSKPPKSVELVEIFLDEFKPSFFERIKGVNVRLHNLSDYINKKLKKKLLLLVDEGHEADIETLEWLRSLTDQVENMQIIISGLHTLEDTLSKKLETLYSRINTKINLNNLNLEETRELIKKRIENVGGEGISPFTDSVIEKIYEKTGGFPREILKKCDKLVTQAMSEGKTIIDDFEEEAEKELSEKPINRDFLRDLPYKQRKIIKVLSREENMFPSEIAQELGFDKYKTKQHAVRSVNNILRRMMEDKYVERKKRGKGYVYYLTIKIKNILIES